MAMNVGNAACTTGMSKGIYDAIVGGVSTGFSSPMTSSQLDALRAGAHAAAVGVVAEIILGGVVTLTVPVNAFGAGIPSAPVTLTGYLT